MATTTTQGELRKHQHTLMSVGAGVILFGLWSVVKSVLYLVVSDPIGQELADVADPETYMYSYRLSLILTILVVLMDVLLRWYVGMKTRRMGIKEQKPGIGFYLAWGYIFLIDAYELVTGFTDLIKIDGEMFDSLVTMLVDLTSLVTLVEMMVAIRMIRGLKKSGALEGGGTDQ